jgi:hypothetical protein
MSTSLLCNNCKSPIRKSNQEEVYENNFFYKNDNGQPICKYCGPKNYSDDFGWVFIGMVIIALIAIVFTIV